jgi:phosphoglycerate dehydrogenase-like enzyme
MRWTVLFWVPTKQIAATLAGLPGVAVEVVAPDGSPLPPGAADVEFYVPPFFPAMAAITVIAQLPSLRVVQAQTAGVERLLPHVRPGITLCNARGVHDASTAEWVVAVTLAALRDLPYFATEQAAQRWSYRFTDSLAGKSVLIVGYGSIGGAVERRLSGFEVEIRRVARRPRDGVSAISELPELLPHADVVILLAPVTPETIGMVDARFLARMKDGALLVNAARGSLVVTAALTEELQRGRLRAAVDVTDPEPLPAGHPWWGLGGVLITPHVAASTSAQDRRMLAFLRAQAERFTRGETLANVVAGAY